MPGAFLPRWPRSIITNYQANANDPPAFVPSIVDEAQVFFEHTPGQRQRYCTTSGDRCPSRATGPLVHYYNLTPSKVTHSGKTGIEFWYRNFIVPSLGNQAPLVQELQLNGQIDQAQVVSTGLNRIAVFGEPGHRRPRMIGSTAQSKWFRPTNRSFPARLRRARSSSSRSVPRPSHGIMLTGRNDTSR